VTPTRRTPARSCPRSLRRGPTRGPRAPHGLWPALVGCTIGAKSTTATLRRVASDSFTCPRCGRTSHRPTDVAEGSCAACQDWTGRGATTGIVDPQLQARAQELAWRAREQHGDPHRDVCAHCAAGNHDNCDGHAWCDAIDVGVDCTCALEDHPPFKGP